MKGLVRSERMCLMMAVKENSRAKFNIYDAIVMYPTSLDTHLLFLM